MLKLPYLEPVTQKIEKLLPRGKSNSRVIPPVSPTTLFRVAKGETTRKIWKSRNMGMSKSSISN